MNKKEHKEINEELRKAVEDGLLEEVTPGHFTTTAKGEADVERKLRTSRKGRETMLALARGHGKEIELPEWEGVEASDFTVTVFEDSPRAEVFEQIFGSRTVPVTSPVPEVREISSFDEPQRVYNLQVNALDEDTWQRLVDVIADLHGDARETVRRQIAMNEGLAIIADEVVLTIENPHRHL